MKININGNKTQEKIGFYGFFKLKYTKKIIHDCTLIFNFQIVSISFSKFV
jgi:hypothetical protein